MVGVDQSAVDDFVIKLQKLLENRDLKGIQSAIDDPSNEILWAQGVWPAFDAVGPFLKGVNEAGEDLIVAPKFSSALRSIVRHVSRVAKPKEALLAILEALEKFDDDGVAYGHLLDSLAPVLTRLGEESGGRRKKTFILALNTAFRHIRKLPSLHIDNLEKMSELNFVDQGTEMTRTVGSLSSMVDFLARLSPEMESRWAALCSKKKRKNSSQSPSCLPNPLTCDDAEIQAYVKQVLALLACPLAPCHPTLPPDDGQDDYEPSSELLAKIGISSQSHDAAQKASHSDLRSLFHRLLRILVHFCPDFVKLLAFLETEVARVEKLVKKREDDDEFKGDGEAEDEQEEEEGEKMVELTWVSGGSLVHACFHELLGGAAEDSSSQSFSLPAVYSQRHLLSLCAPFLPALLNDDELLILKGIQTLESLTRRFEDASLDRDVLSDLYFRRVLSAVTERVLIRCSSKLIRRRAVEWIRDLAPKFDASGRFFYVRGLYFNSDHAGFKGYVLTYLLKPEIEAALKRKDEGVEPVEAEEAHSFIGSNMKSWFKTIFSLAEGVETDLMQHQDSCMAALNLLRYLLIRDPFNKNFSGIWDLRRVIEKDFLAVFRKAIEMSRAHFELELSKVKSNEKDANEPEITVDIEGSRPKLSPEQEMESLQSALVNFDIMESVLCRVDELIDTPSKGKEKDS